MHFLSKVYLSRLANFNETFQLDWLGEDSDNNDGDDSGLVLYWHVMIQLIQYIMELAVITTDILLIYVMTRFRKLREGNLVYIWHFFVANFLTTTCIFLMEILREATEDFGNFTCTGYSLYFVFSFCCLWMMLFAGLDWYLSSSNNKYACVFRKWGIVVIYGINTVKFALLLTACYVPQFQSYQYMGILTICGTVGCIGILNIMAYNKEISEYHSKSRYIFKIATYYLAVWSLHIYMFVAVYIALDYSSLFHIIMGIYEVVSVVVCSMPIMLAYWLGRWNSDFKTAYKLAVCCWRRKYNQGEIREMEHMMK